MVTRSHEKFMEPYQTLHSTIAFSHLSIWNEIKKTVDQWKGQLGGLSNHLRQTNLAVHWKSNTNWNNNRSNTPVESRSSKKEATVDSNTSYAAEVSCPQVISVSLLLIKSYPVRQDWLQRFIPANYFKIVVKYLSLWGFLQQVVTYTHGRSLRGFKRFFL